MSWSRLCQSSALLRPVCFLLFGLCGLVHAQASSQAGVPQTLAQLQQQLAAEPTRRAHFHQEKAVAGLAAPLLSRGELLFSHSKGLWWHQQQPFELTLLLDDSRLVQQLAGQPAEVITAQANPQLFEFSHLLLNLFRSDTQALERQFVLGFTPGVQGWQLLLTPKQPPLNQIFSSLELAGAQSLDRLTIRDRQGDTTRLSFTPVLPNPVELSDVELRRFAP